MRTPSTRGRRYRLWGRMAVACLLLGVTTLALVAFEVLVVAIVTYTTGAVVYALFETTGFGPATATALTVPVVAIGIGLGREVVHAVSRVLVERGQEHKLRRTGFTYCFRRR
jgi:predicted membrane channel-forming protein YqfA (hemolysin III family)